MDEISLALQQLQLSLRKTSERPSVRRRLKWAIHDKTSVDRAQTKVEEVKTTLMIVLLLLDLRLSTLPQTSLGSIQADQQTPQRQISMELLSRRREPRAPGFLSGIEDETDDHATGNFGQQPVWEYDAPYEHARNTRSVASRKLINWAPYQSSGTYYRQGHNHGATCWAIASVSRDNQKLTYKLSSGIILPRWLGRRALITELKLRQYLLSWFSVSLVSGIISVVGYQPTEAPVVRACFRGDESTVRDLLQAGRAGPNDRFLASVEDEMQCLRISAGEETSLLAVRTPLRSVLLLAKSLLQASIVSGNVRLVNFLVSVGADVNVGDSWGAR